MQKTWHTSPTFILLGSLFVTFLLISNIIAGKLIIIFNLVLPAAVILFPLSYIISDVLTETYGFERSRLIIWTGFLCNIIMSVVFLVVIALPYPDFWTNQTAYFTVLGTTPRVVVASLIAYLVGSFSNSIVLSRMKILTRGKWLFARTIASTLIGEAVDSALFITIAFLGSISTPILVQMILIQYTWKIIYEIITTPINI